MIDVIEPHSEAELDEVRTLMRGFLSWGRERYRKEIELVERYFDPTAFEIELRGLPGEYSRPAGRLLLARLTGRSAGCVALRDSGSGFCEMKRLYVDPRSYGKGVGRALVLKLLDEAKRAGYSAMRLDTGPRNFEAQSLYRSIGFRTVQPYYDMPDELRSWLVFMELDLSGGQNV
jgi:ribosomal protein S18 acetylase RimI-like enzyme